MKYIFCILLFPLTVFSQSQTESKNIFGHYFRIQEFNSAGIKLYPDSTYKFYSKSCLISYTDTGKYRRIFNFLIFFSAKPDTGILDKKGFLLDGNKIYDYQKPSYYIKPKQIPNNVRFECAGAFCNKEKKIAQSGYFVNGKLFEGSKYIYNKKGKLLKIGIYENKKWLRDSLITTNRNNKNELKEGKYFGCIFRNEVFVKIKNDTAILDWVITQKWAQEFFTDTIIITNKGDGKWKGRIASVVEKKKRLYVEGVYPSAQNTTTTWVKIELNEKAYKDCEPEKNSAFMYKEGTDFNNDNKNRSNGSERWIIRNRLIRDFEIIERMDALDYKDFIKDYALFKREFLRKLEEEDKRFERSKEK